MASTAEEIRGMKAACSALKLDIETRAMDSARKGRKERGNEVPLESVRSVWDLQLHVKRDGRF